MSWIRNAILDGKKGTSGRMLEKEAQMKLDRDQLIKSWEIELEKERAHQNDLLGKIDLSDLETIFQELRNENFEVSGPEFGYFDPERPDFNNCSDPWWNDNLGQDWYKSIGKRGYFYDDTEGGGYDGRSCEIDVTYLALLTYCMQWTIKFRHKRHDHILRLTLKYPKYSETSPGFRILNGGDKSYPGRFIHSESENWTEIFKRCMSGEISRSIESDEWVDTQKTSQGGGIRKLFGLH